MILKGKYYKHGNLYLIELDKLGLITQAKKIKDIPHMVEDYLTCLFGNSTNPHVTAYAVTIYPKIKGIEVWTFNITEEDIQTRMAWKK